MMILYNTTINIDEDVHEQWLGWMKTFYIPLLMQTGYFVDKKLLQILDEEANGGVTYCLQLFLNEKEDFEEYQKKFYPTHFDLFNKKYHNKYVNFTTLLNVLEE